MENYRIIVKGIVHLEEEYLLVRRWYNDRIEEPYQWEFIDSRIEFGEEPDKAVLRAIYEQTGLAATIDRIAYTWSYLIGDTHCIGISYECTAMPGDVILSEELDGYCLVAKEELRNCITNKRLLRDVEKALGLSEAEEV